MATQNSVKKIAIASDHGGYELKKAIVELFLEKGIEFDDIGTNSTESVDYPDFAHDVAGRIANGQNSRAILICGTGIGMSITANRYENVRAALCNDVFSAKMSRQHNDANVLVLGGRVVGPGLAREIVDTWLQAEFEGGRHLRRLGKIENEHLKNVVHAVVSRHIKEKKEMDENGIKKIVSETIDQISQKNEKEKK